MPWDYHTISVNTLHEYGYGGDGLCGAGGGPRMRFRNSGDQDPISEKEGSRTV
jgi:hypothetical protein